MQPGGNLTRYVSFNAETPGCVRYDGAATPPAYRPPVFTGKEPEVEVEGGQILLGNCHCGGVRLAIKTKPLHEANNLVFQSRVCVLLLQSSCNALPDFE